MERRETYDPEDIESLLSERAFDELLEEERAFVLRHLSGRDEYEAMRALLMQVRQDERPDAGLELDDAVKDRVMATFRAERRPRWGFSLNSVLAAFWPRQMADLWRPALALGGLAAAVLLTVTIWHRTAGGEVQLAELRQEQEKAVPVPPAASIEPQAGTADSTYPTANGMASTKYNTTFDMVQNEDLTLGETSAPAEPEVLPMTATATDSQSTPMVARKAEATAEMDAGTDDLALEKEMEVKRVVESRELVRNMTLSNTSVESVKKTTTSKDRTRATGTPAVSLADTPELKDLLAAAW